MIQQKFLIPVFALLLATGCATTSAPLQIANPELLTAFEQENPVPANMARLYFLHGGAWKKKGSSAHTVYQDIQLDEQQKYRFKEGDYVVYDVSAGQHHVKTWAACGMENGVILKEGDDIHPNKDGFYTKLFDKKLSGLQAGKIYVYNFYPDCWLNQYSPSTKGLDYYGFIKPVVDARPLAAVYNKQLVTIEVK